MTDASQATDSVALGVILALETDGVALGLDAACDLIASPIELLTAHQREQLQATRAGVVQLLQSADDGVRQRVAHFKGLIATSSDVVLPALVYQPDLVYRAGACFSCDATLTGARFGRCWRCSLAAKLAARCA